MQPRTPSITTLLEDCTDHSSPLRHATVQSVTEKKDETLIVLTFTDVSMAKKAEETLPKVQKCLKKKNLRKPKILITVEKNQQKAEPQGVSQVRHIIAVGSGKGGVGKSTLSVALAQAFSDIGWHTGLLDADIYGPSAPSLLGLHRRPQQEGDQLLPLSVHDKLCFMSMGLMIDPEKAAIWRGPMVQSALRHMLEKTRWGELDVLVVDLPPGTGDIQLSLGQRASLSGAIIVSTAQDVALADAKLAAEMFQKLSIPVLGLVENMSLWTCDSCGHQTSIFTTGGVEKWAKSAKLPFLGHIPLLPSIVQAGQAGQLLKDADPRVFGEVFAPLAQHIATILD